MSERTALVQSTTRVNYWLDSRYVTQGPYSEDEMRAETARGLPKGTSFRKTTRVETVITEKVPHE